ncbi:MerR family transcriptional regulator [Runella sp. CRIBMP]|nr:MerR family transcriptional regulator [Runella sp. CRIBMP]
MVTLNEWEKNGLMPKKITVNGRVRFRRDEILATLETVKQVKHKKRAA